MGSRCWERAHSVPVTSQGWPDRAPGKCLQISHGPPSNGLRVAILHDLASGDPAVWSLSQEAAGKAGGTTKARRARRECGEFGLWIS
jgi:hypothetical protein